MTSLVLKINKVYNERMKEGVSSKIKLSNDPITEAVIEFVFSPLTDEVYNKILKNLSSDADKEEPFDRYHVNFGNAPSVNKDKIGTRFFYKHEKFVLLMRPNGITFSRLKPYCGFEDFRSYSISLWNRIQGIANLTKINRVGIRYINSFVIPVSGVYVAEYLTAPPRVPNELPSQITEFISRVVIGESKSTEKTILTQVLNPGPTLKSSSVIVDIDIFKEEEIAYSNDSLWSLIDEYKKKINEYFYKTITKKTLDMLL